MAHHFGLGFLAGAPAAGTPVPFAILDDVSISFKQTKKKLRGQWRDPVAVGDAERDVTFKVKHASVKASAMNLIAAATITTGSKLPAVGELATIPATPYQVTVTNSANWVADYGVLDLTSGKWGTVAATPSAAGEYSVTAGVYTFYSGDASHKLSINYSYTGASAGKTLAVVNTVMAPSTGMILVAYAPLESGTCFGLKFYNAHFEDFTVGMKAADFLTVDLTGFAAQDSTSTALFDEWTAE